MKKIHIIILGILCLGFCYNANAQVVVVDNSFSDSMLCVNGSFTVPITVTSGAFDDTNTFRVEISNASGSFNNPKTVGQLGGKNNGNASCILPSSIAAGTGYRIRIKSTYPSYTSIPFHKTVRVSNYPSVNLSSNGPLCEGNHLQLSASTTSPLPSFNWTGPVSITNPTSATPTVSNIPSSGNGTYKVTTTSYKCSSVDTIDVLVTSKPIITGWTTDTFACEGQPFEITPTCNVCTLPSGSINYDWTYPPNGTSKQSYINLLNSKPSNQGTYKVTIYIGPAANNCSVTDSFTHAVIKKLPDTPSATNTGPLCVGDDLVLNGISTTPGVSYKWVGPNGFFDSGATSNSSTLPNIPKAAEGEYRLYAVKNGCESKPRATDVRVGIPLFPLPITGDSTLCPGDKLQLSTQTSTPQGIKWKKLPDTTTPISINRTFSISGVAGKDAGIYMVTQEILGCESPPSYINVIIPDLKNPNVKNNGPICPGETLEFTAVETTGGTYNWTGPDGFISNAQNPTVNNVSSANQGVYTVIASLDFCTLTSSTEVVVKAKPQIVNINSNSPVCTYSYLELSTECDLDSAAYLWSGPAGFTSTDQNPSIYFLENISGVYSVRATVDGCVSEPLSTKVLSKEGPGITKVKSNSPLKEGDQLELFAQNDKDSVVFFWKGPEGFESNEQNPIIPVSTYWNSGEYEVFSVYNTCTTSTKVHVIVEDILGITLDLYPNPNDGIFNIKGITQTDATIHLSIFNHLGGIVFRDEIIPNQSKFEQQIDIHGSPSGVYLLQLITGAEKKTVRFTIVNQ